MSEIVTLADQASVAAELGGDPSKARTAPKQALQRKLLDGLRHLVRSELKLNQPHASDGWLTQDGLWLVSKTVCDKLRAYLLSQGMEGIPSDNNRVFSELQDHGIAQATTDGKAIWRATVTSGDGSWSHTFTFLKVAPGLIWDTEDRPASFTGSVRSENGQNASVETPRSEPASIFAAPSANPSPFRPERDVQDALDSAISSIAHDSTENVSGPHRAAEEVTRPPQSIESPLPAAESHPNWSAANTSEGDESPGSRFCAWLRNGIAQRRIIINDAKALVHTVAGTAYLVTPGIFMRYAQEHPEIDRVGAEHKMAGWQWIQKQFERLRIHKKQANGLNVWPCEVKGPRKTRRVHGYVLQDASVLFVDLPPDNPYLTLITETVVSEARSHKAMRGTAAS